MPDSKPVTKWLWPADPDQLSGWDRLLRHFCRFLYIFFEEFKRDRISLRSAALTYSIVLSLVPMLALSTAVLKGMGAGDQMRQAAYRLIDNLSDKVHTDAAEPGQEKAAVVAVDVDGGEAGRYPVDFHTGITCFQGEFLPDLIYFDTPVPVRGNKDQVVQGTEIVGVVF